MFERSKKWSNNLFVGTQLSGGANSGGNSALWYLKGPIYIDILAQVRSSVALKQVVVTAYYALVCISVLYTNQLL